jgi:hypothetical protein
MGAFPEKAHIYRRITMFKVPQALIDCIEKYERPLTDDKKISQVQIERIRDLMAAMYGLGIVSGCCIDYALCGESHLSQVNPLEFEEPTKEILTIGKEKEFEFVAEYASMFMTGN